MLSAANTTTPLEIYTADATQKKPKVDVHTQSWVLSTHNQDNDKAV